MNEQHVVYSSSLDSQILYRETGRMGSGWPRGDGPWCTLLRAGSGPLKEVGQNCHIGNECYYYLPYKIIGEI